MAHADQRPAAAATQFAGSPAAPEDEALSHKHALALARVAERLRVLQVVLARRKRDAAARHHARHQALAQALHQLAEHLQARRQAAAQQL